MSNRSILEFNHDYAPREEELTDFARKIDLYLGSGNPSHLPNGVRQITMGHHSDNLFEKVSKALGVEKRAQAK